MPIMRKAGSNKLLRVGANLGGNQECCNCGPIVAINICNFNKWSDEIHDAVLNGHLLTRPTVHVDGQCGGGYYVNLDPMPDYCSLRTVSNVTFRCCGGQVGGNCGGTNYPGGIYPATGAANEESCANQKSATPQNCGQFERDCSGDLITQSYPSSYLVTGTNTLTVNRTGPTRTAGSYGVVEVAKLEQIEEEWRIATFLATGTYSSANLTLTWSL